jgi:gas vesicle protein
MAGLIAGAAAGAALALLYAPMSGRETVDALRRHFRNASADAREAGKRAEADILARYHQVKTASMTTLPGPESLQPKLA